LYIYNLYSAVNTLPQLAAADQPALTLATVQLPTRKASVADALSAKLNPITFLHNEPV